MASEEELLVTREVYDEVREKFIKEARDKRRLFLVKQGGDETWVRGLTDDEVIHHGLVLKKVIKARLEFKWAETKPAVEKESGSDMAAFVEMMKMQMEQSRAELKAREIKEERELKAREAELKAREARDALALEQFKADAKAREARDALALEQAKADAKARDEQVRADAKARDARDEQARAHAKALLLQLQADNAKVIEQMKVERKLAAELANKEAEAREQRLVESKEAEKKAQLELLEKMESQRRGENDRAKVAQRQKDDALDSRIKKFGDI